MEESFWSVPYLPKWNDNLGSTEVKVRKIAYFDQQTKFHLSMANLLHKKEPNMKRILNAQKKTAPVAPRTGILLSVASLLEMFA